MKIFLLIVLIVAAAAAYNYALAEHGPAIYKAINGPKPATVKRVR